MGTLDYIKYYIQVWRNDEWVLYGHATDDEDAVEVLNFGVLENPKDIFRVVDAETNELLELVSRL